MKIKLSKSQWETIGKTAGWTKTANSPIPNEPTPMISREVKLKQDQDAAFARLIEGVKKENWSYKVRPNQKGGYVVEVEIPIDDGRVR